MPSPAIVVPATIALLQREPPFPEEKSARLNYSVRHSAQKQTQCSVSHCLVPDYPMARPIAVSAIARLKIVASTETPPAAPLANHSAEPFPPQHFPPEHSPLNRRSAPRPPEPSQSRLNPRSFLLHQPPHSEPQFPAELRFHLPHSVPQPDSLAPRRHYQTAFDRYRPPVV